MPVNTTRTLKDEEAEKKHKLTKDWPVICYPIWPCSLLRTNLKFAGIFPRGKLDFLGGIRDVPEFLPATSEFLV